MSEKMTNLFVKLTSVRVADSHETIRPSCLFGGKKPGTMVAVRPCGEKYEGKTYLGMYLCSAPTGVIGEQQGERLLLRMTDYTNPAIYIPDLDEIVWGYASWWGQLKDAEQLQQITDRDIQNVWYVRALNQLAQHDEPPAAPEQEPTS